VHVKLYGVGFQVLGTDIRVRGHILPELVRVFLDLLERTVVAVEYAVCQNQDQRNADGHQVAEVEHDYFSHCRFRRGTPAAGPGPIRTSI
jgi:hypothetical protein